MKHKLQQIKEESQELCAEISSELRTSKDHLDQIGDEYHRVTKLSHAPMVIINEIDRQFKKRPSSTVWIQHFFFQQLRYNVSDNMSLLQHGSV